ncbi:hypothetical protein F5148DRAFT_1225683 [Russula earlei]|uniref:Uncharacterized protein n=1 Tax=Russula earlei TaxID=71964 RepID=A0ACC0U065_9AGAM|nr:hypothetical protein F5148DRAFT_1225683 [Russula earlei]
MRPTAILFSFLATSLALFSYLPAIYAAPVPSQVGSALTKRCGWEGCRISEPTSATGAPSQSPVLALVDSLINALTAFRDQASSSNTTSPSTPTPVSTINLDTGDVPPATDSTTGGSPAIDTTALAGAAL